MSVMEGARYLILTPFGVGDTGATAAAYGSQPYIVLPAFAIAIAITFWLAMRFARPAVRHTAADLTSLRAFTFFPWIGGTIAVLVPSGIDVVRSGTAFSSGSIVAVLLGTVAIGVFAPMAMPFASRFARGNPTSAASERQHLQRVPVVGLVVIVGISVLNLAVLGGGLNVG